MKRILLSSIVLFIFTLLTLNANASDRTSELKTQKEISVKKVKKQNKKIGDCCTTIGLTDICNQCFNFNICSPSWAQTLQTVRDLQDLFELPVCFTAN